ncbi:glycosyltransferase [Hydrogenophilus thermoluteolus]|uniref:glycosyltransferase n=1 Tax=Hydrogenophilus thermoluteolus TaxID=297 RepID=UPI0025528EAA|nr:glycosyltransferase [Hydrogenophilus thermoluteolus]
MISVLMAVNRLDRYLDEAIRSILEQTLTDFEFIIIVNGPDAENIKIYIQEKFFDERIKIVKSDISQLAYALNVGIDLAKYDLIARMDADDVAKPERLAKQMDYLTRNSLDMVGSGVILINQDGIIVGERKMPAGDKINNTLPYKNCFVHSTILAKKKIFLQARGYNSGFNSEDYDLWLRLKRLGVKWDNLEENLLSYRIHQDASQRRLLGYAESAGYALREFILKKNVGNFFALIFHIVKAFTRPDRNKSAY